MNDAREDRLTTRWRGRLFSGVLVMAVFAVLAAGHAAVQVHACFETRESLAHWRGRLAEGPGNETGDETGAAAWGLESPARRIRDLESDLDRIAERFLVSAACFVLFGGFAIVGGRAWKRRRR